MRLSKIYTISVNPDFAPYRKSPNEAEQVYKKVTMAKDQEKVHNRL